MNIRKNILSLILIVCAVITTYGQNIQLRLFNNKEVKELSVQAYKGKWQIFTNIDKPYKFKKNKSVRILAEGDKLSLWEGKHRLGIYDTLHIMAMSVDNSIVLMPNKVKHQRRYSGDFKLMANNNTLQVDNILSIADYLAGVVEAEAGYNAPLEYYKVQAIISRTYLYKIISKDRQATQSNNYFIGDDVTYQVYKGVTNNNPDIKKAVLHTRGLVIVDTAFTLITAVFHSNSGGVTANSEDVWLTSRPYLKQTNDPFSLEQRNSEWSATIPISKWLKYFKQKGIDVNNASNKQKLTNIGQNERIKYFVINGDTLLFTDIRYHFKLKSAWFSARKENNNIVLKGRGYGHGVGLSQQGAIQMAKEQHSFLDIIYFYYKNVRVVHLSTIFFNVSQF